MKTEMAVKTALVLLVVLIGSILAQCAPAPGAAPQQGASGSGAPSITPKPAAEEPTRGGVLTIYVTQDHASMDPHQETTIFQVMFTRPVYSTLLRLDPTKFPEEVIIGDLADKWEASQDAKTWTFYLRKGVKFHDGSPLSSEDVKFSFERLANPPQDVKGPAKELWQRIASIETPDPGTVRVTLRSASAWFINLMTISNGGIVPKKLVSADQKALLLSGVGAGPFKFKAWSRSVATELARNDAYYLEGKPYLDGIRGVIIPDVVGQIAAFRTGQILMTGHGTRGLTMSEARTLEKEMPGLQIVESRTYSRHLFTMNTQKKPFDDVRVRRAVLTVLDQQTVIDLGMEGLGFKGGAFPGKWDLSQEQLSKLPPYRGPNASDIDAAKKLLAEAGYAEGFKTTFNQGNAPGYEEVQLAINNQLRKIGIDAKVRVLAYPVELRTAAINGDFELMWIPAVAVLDDPDSYLSAYITKGSDNFGKFSDKTIDDLAQKQTALIDFTARKKVLDEIQMRIWEMAPAWPAVWPRHMAGANPRVRGWKGMNSVYQNLEFDHIWLAK